MRGIKISAWGLCLATLFVAALAMAQEEVAGALLAAPVESTPPLFALAILLGVPALIAALKKAVPSLPAWAPPLLAPILGALAAIVDQVTVQSGDINVLWGAVLGGGGVGVREMFSQGTKALTLGSAPVK